MTKDYLKKLISIGFSVIPCEESKKPLEKSWTTSENKTAEDVDRLNPYYWGCRAGYNDIECIDVDLKVLPSLPERKEWWDEYLNFLCDNIEDFLNKVVIAKTVKGGYHIIYKTKVKAGNTKIACLQGMRSAIVETRGVGGQFILYGEFLGEREYHHIDYITDEEREILWYISKTYDYKEQSLAEVPKKSEFKKINETDITPWEDFNSKKTAFDIIGDEFTVVRNTSKAYVIKRHGATSPHSGYIFKDSGCMYLFSTGTQYPNEKLLSPFNLYTIKHHNGDYTESTRDLYSQNYGTRRIKKIYLPEIKIDKQDLISRVVFPIEIFPNEIQHFIIESSKTLGLSIDYMGCAFMWMMSLIVGNSMHIEVKPGWREVATLWIALVGKPGIGKTPSINQMIAPLRALNVKEQREYQKNYQKYTEYASLDKKEKEHREEVQKPKNKQFIVGDVTLEALVDLHEENPNALGIFKDELAGWLKDMNKYRAGSDLEFWLSSWSGSPISLNRKTAKNAFVDKPFIPVLGGIQPSIFEEFSNGSNKENGFVDRILISYPELYVNKYNNNHISQEMLTWYNDFVVMMKQKINKLFLKFNEHDQIEPSIVRFDNESEKEWVRIHDEITDIQNSDTENEYMKSMLPKQKSYIPRFALLINTLWSVLDGDYKQGFIHVESILRAEKLSKYFVNMAKLVKQDAKEKQDLNKVAKDKLTTFDKFKAMYEADPKLNKTVVAEMLDVSRQSIYQWIKKLEENEK